jgi:putative membrane protein
MRAMPLTLGLIVLAAAWLGPLPGLAGQSFSAHMAMHMAVVALAAPLLALAVSGTFDLARPLPWFFAPIPASMIEFVVVWAWHTPALHHAARQETWGLVLEQASFIASGLLLWIAAVGGAREQPEFRNGPASARPDSNELRRGLAVAQAKAGAGVVGLLFTSMHMTLLGALFALAPRPLYPHLTNGPAGFEPLADQHLGGAIMLLVGGMSYLIGGLALTAALLRSSPVGQRKTSS